MWSILGISILLVAALIVHYLLVAQGRIIVGPETYIILMGISTFATTAYAGWSDGQAGHPYAVFIGMGLLAYMAGIVVFSALARFRHRADLKAFQERAWVDDLHGVQFAAFLAIGLVSALVAAAYFFLLGFFVPYDAFQSLLAGGPALMIEVYNQLRETSSSGGAYLGLGYVSQFKNVLLPLVTVLLYFRQKVRPSLGHRLLFLLFLLASVLSLVGRGARFPLANFGALFLIIGTARYMFPYRFTRTQLTTIAVVFLILLSVLTLMMGARGQRKWSQHPLLWAPFQVVERVSVGPALERYEVYERFLVHSEPQWGLGIVEELEHVLPGRINYTLSNRLHEMLYGNPLGNVSLDIWGSLWYDFRWWSLGLLFAFGGFSHLFYVRLLRGPKRFIRVVTLSYAGFILGFATDLQVLILHGFVTCLIFLAIIWAVRQVRRIRG
ncbi:MAG TPA: hypothetical protein VLU25_07550 [Acidobacteriota bacterium]|nr:hypothetical protein [Acidobacteriota bacterium]